MKRFSIPPREERERHSHTMSAYVYLQSRTGPLTAGLVFIGHLIYLTGN